MIPAATTMTTIAADDQRRRARRADAGRAVVLGVIRNSPWRGRRGAALEFARAPEGKRGRIRAGGSGARATCTFAITAPRDSTPQTPVRDSRVAAGAFWGRPLPSGAPTRRLEGLKDCRPERLQA